MQRSKRRSTNCSGSDTAPPSTERLDERSRQDGVLERALGKVEVATFEVPNLPGYQVPTEGTVVALNALDTSVSSTSSSGYYFVPTTPSYLGTRYETRTTTASAPLSQQFQFPAGG